MKRFTLFAAFARIVYTICNNADIARHTGSHFSHTFFPNIVDMFAVLFTLLYAILPALFSPQIVDISAVNFTISFTLSVTSFRMLFLLQCLRCVSYFIVCLQIGHIFVLFPLSVTIFSCCLYYNDETLITVLSSRPYNSFYLSL